MQKLPSQEKTTSCLVNLSLKYLLILLTLFTQSQSLNLSLINSSTQIAHH